MKTPRGRKTNIYIYIYSSVTHLPTSNHDTPSHAKPSCERATLILQEGLQCQCWTTLSLTQGDSRTWLARFSIARLGLGPMQSKLYASNSAWMVSFGRLDWSITSVDLKNLIRHLHGECIIDWIAICEHIRWLDATCNYTKTLHLSREKVQIQPTCSSLSWSKLLAQSQVLWVRLRSLIWELILHHQEINRNIQLGSF